MKLPVDGHAGFRELISARLDAPLTATAQSDLEQHLAGCSRCRSVERDYRAQRDRLAALPQIPAPRDLWARTSAALDTELARSPRASRRAARADGLGDRGPGSRMLAVSAASSLLLALVVIATQLDAGVTIAPAPNVPRGAALPTAFDIRPESVVIADFTADGVTVYQTEVAQVCPTPMIECSAADTGTHPVLRITGSGGRSGMAVQSNQGRLALLAVNATGQETISVVTLPTNATGTGSSAATGSSRPAPGGATNGSTAPPATPARPTRRPGTSPGTPQSTGRAPQTPARPGSSPAATNRPTRSPRAVAPTPRATRPGVRGPGSSPLTGGSPSLLTGSPAPDGSMAVTSVAILDRVRTAGAPAAWSPDGDMLAFSAMPADRSSGPDLYVWRPGDSRAQRLTSDHSSYFASWAGTRIVISRVLPSSRAKRPATGTFVMDPANGATRQVALSGMWLPAVDPKSRWAVSWMGTLVAVRNGVTPSAGGLYLVDWRSVNPFVDHKAVAAPTATPDADAKATGRPAATAAPSRSLRHRGGTARVVRPLTARGLAAPAAPSSASSADTSTPQALEPDRDETADPVLDWQVRWSNAGGTFAYWIADAPGANWGRLAVLRLLPSAAGIDFHIPPLEPTLARRSFSLGSDRVAWIAASDDQPAGELRLRTWDLHGYGGLRIHDVNVDGGVPAF